MTNRNVPSKIRSTKGILIFSTEVFYREEDFLRCGNLSSPKNKNQKTFYVEVISLSET